MGAKQSKRSVDISGKEAEGAGEVVAAGGEGRVEPLADADTLKPQLNGDTPHIQPPVEISEKEKQLDNGTPENEKDATTEKETVVTNGSGGEEDNKPEQENGDAKPTVEAENNKKNKKEKVKKKWSLRSISFSRKEKPKQEKKQKDEEPKTNGDTELPEEGTDASAIAESKITEEVKNVAAVEESKDGKTPETPVTEPITNGSSAPETPKEEALAKDGSPALSPAAEKPVEEIKAPEEPEQLPLNGLKLEDVKEEVAEVKIVEPAKENPAPAPDAPAPVPDIPVTNEVCVGQSPLKEPTPPPLPANPPPSSVTAFAETTMAPHLVETATESVKPPSTTSAEVAFAIESVPLNCNVDSQAHISLPLKDAHANDEPQNNVECEIMSQAVASTPETKENSSVQLPVQEETKENSSVQLPVQEETKENSSVQLPVQEETKENSSVQLPVQEETKENSSVQLPQEETKENSSLQTPVQEKIEQQKEELKPLETSLAKVEVKDPAVPVVETLIETTKECDIADSSPKHVETIADELPQKENIEELKQVPEINAGVSSEVQQNIIIEDAKENSEKVSVTDVVPPAPLVLEVAEESNAELISSLVTKENFEIIPKDDFIIKSLINEKVEQSHEIVSDVVQCSSVTKENFEITPKDDIILKSLINEKVELSQEIVSDVSASLRPESLPAVLSSTVEESIPKNEPAQSPGSPVDSMAASLSEVLPPPVPEEATQENIEDASESFPLPPSELCPSESEASGATSPELLAEPQQELAAPTCEKSAEIVVPETTMDKINIDDIMEAPASGSTEIVAQAGSGDGIAAAD